MSNKAKIREEAKKLNPIDDLMFRTMAEDKNFCEEILRVFLSDPRLSVLESTSQYAGTNLQGRSVILDAKCILGDGRETDIEVQKANDTDHQRRVRYNGAILTTNLTDPGAKFQNIPYVCVVFISRFDLFSGNRSLYHVDRVIRELMEVFVDDAAYNSKFPVTSGSKRRYKETEEGQQVMCEIMEKIAQEERNEGRIEFQMQLMIELLPEDM